ncbi:hypothetical protein B0J18DRAFT_444854 [Chaetomium sp. MPI-SDFR-AT-0129]|nr:hypothetical protein B0J18DRAFT_444854 [Chaetomium sp. MPI-SDFR-AT-0129]
MKRKTAPQEGEPLGSSKRRQTEHPPLSIETEEPASLSLRPRNPRAVEPDPTFNPDDEDEVSDSHDKATTSTPSDTHHPQPTPPTTTAATSLPGTTPSGRAGRARKFPSDLKTIPCTYPSCPKTFNRPARLTAHLRSHTNDRPHKCPYPPCSKTYLEEKHLAQHIKGSHTHEKKYICGEEGCDKSFVTATRLRRHAAVHEGKERYRCRGFEGCGLSFRKHQTLQRHVRVAHLGLAAFVCNRAGEGSERECGAGFDSAGALRRHVEREHGEVRFWCEECGGEEEEGDEDEEEEERDGKKGGRRVGFRTLLMLQTHMRKEHINCVFCEVRCGKQSDLERHVDMYHSGTTVEDRKTIACTWEGCGKKFTRVPNLNVHIRTAHQGVRFVCGQVDTDEIADIADWNWREEGCGQPFISKMKLEEHVRYVHLGRKRPAMQYTAKSARPGEEDEMSAAVPTRTIPCSVEGCDAMFIRHHDLDKHIRKTHPELQEDAIDPRLLGGVGGRGKEQQFWTESTEPGFDTEWAEMRRLIDLDALMDAKESGET